MGWDWQNVIANLIVIEGNPDGLFVYSGTPALGNPPVAMIVAPGTTTDPYGNPAASIAQFGNLAGSHLGIGNDGSLFLVNAAGKVIFLGRTTDGSFFWYNSSGEGPQNLSASIAPTNTTDPAGNSVNAGFQVHGTGSAANAAGNVEINVQTGPVPIAFFTTGASEITTSGNIQASIQNPGASQQNVLFVVGPQIITHTAYVDIVMQSPAKDGSAVPTGRLEYFDGTNLHDLLIWSPSGVKTQTLFSSDNNNYDLGELRLTRTSDLVINTLSPGQQIFPGCAIGVGTYEIEGVLHLNLAAAGNPSYQFGGLAAAGVMLIEFIEINEGGPASFGNSASIGSFASAAGGATMGGGGRTVIFKGLMSLSTAGTLGLFAFTSNVADTFTVVWEGSYMNVRPVY